MRQALNIFIFLLIAFLTVQNHLFMAALLVLIFTYRVGALFLIPLAFCIDGFFGAFYHVPLFSIVVSVWYLISELIRPILILRSKSYGEAS